MRPLDEPHRVNQMECALNRCAPYSACVAFSTGTFFARIHFKNKGTSWSVRRIINDESVNREVQKYLRDRPRHREVVDELWN